MKRVAAVLAVPLLVALQSQFAWAEVNGAPAAAAPSHALTPLGMFMAADPIVKGIIVSLLLASVLTWTIWIAKTVELVIARRRVAAGLSVLRQHALLRTASAAFGNDDRLVSRLVREAMSELQLSKSLSNDQSLRERIASPSAPFGRGIRLIASPTPLDASLRIRARPASRSPT